MTDIILPHIEAQDVARLIDNQRDYVDNIIDLNNDVNSHNLLAQFKKMSAPVVLGILKNIKIPELVGFKAVKFSPKDDKPQYILKTQIDTYHKSSYENKEFIDTIAQEIALQFDQVVLRELKYASGTIGVVDAEISNDLNLDISNKIQDIAMHMNEKVNVFPNWLVASSDLIEHIIKSCDVFVPASNNEFTLGCRKHGQAKWNMKDGKTLSLNLYNMTLWQNDLMLLGHKNPTESSYTFYPRLLMMPVLKKSKNESTIRLFTHYTRNLKSMDFYARIKVTNFD